MRRISSSTAFKIELWSDIIWNSSSSFLEEPLLFDLHLSTARPLLSYKYESACSESLPTNTEESGQIIVTHLMAL